MPAEQRTILFDVNETLSDLDPLAGTFRGLGLAPESAATWFAGLLSVEGHSPWKPARDAYLSALFRSGTAPDDAVLVAVHPWDTHGAASAGLPAVWVNRTGAAYPPHVTTPTVTVSALTDLPPELHAGRAS